ncbi:MAG: hypothetical protein BGO49_24285 [Planctomycetales bacterium 71-10]|nr:MAG: hypothetical protein BGO49_24285 [Planctomycetales bacterium 71-10]
MKPRHADLLRDMGCTADLETFRRTLAEVKGELFPDLTDENLAFSRDQAGDYCSEVKKRLAAPKLTRVFILKALVGLRKNRKRKAGSAS